MGSDFTIDADQLQAFARELSGIGVKLGDLDEPNAEAGRVVIAATRPPRASGFLDASTTAEVGPNGVTFASTARYWTFVHYGAPRRNIRARPFFTEALAASATELAAVYADHAAETIATLD